MPPTAREKKLPHGLKRPCLARLGAERGERVGLDRQAQEGEEIGQGCIAIEVCLLEAGVHLGEARFLAIIRGDAPLLPQPVQDGQIRRPIPLG